MGSIQSLAAEFAITIGNPSVWLSIGLALLLGLGWLALGTWVSRAVGLLDSNGPGGETLGVGLGSGLMLIAAWWAAIWSGGRSSFTPVAVGFAVAVGLALVRQVRRHVPVTRGIFREPDGDDSSTWRRNHKSPLLTLAAGAGFVVVIALLYGSTTPAAEWFRCVFKPRS